MSEQLQHDPRTKKQLKDAIWSFLYDPLYKQFELRLNAIVVKNCVLTNSSDPAFVYKGEFYSESGSTISKTFNRLAKPLIPIMEEYLKDNRQLNNYELPYVVGYLNQVLNSSNNIPDYLQLLPQSVHRPVEQLIASCPCESVKLTPESISEFQRKNKVSIDLMKQRMVTNLLI